MSPDRAKRLARAHLYLVCDRIAPERLEGALRGGVDLVQLRMKGARDAEIRPVAAAMRELCHRHGALFLINDRPDLAAELDADGAHIGQDDLSPAAAREQLGPERVLGLSTHSPEQIAAAADAGVDYIGVGPVNETPTKPGRPAVGRQLVAHAAEHATVPFFAIGGIDSRTIDGVLAAGATRVAVVRAITESIDTGAAARTLRQHLIRLGIPEVAGGRA